MDDKLKPCPFCGGAAIRMDIYGYEYDKNAGGSYIACRSCNASSRVVFGEKVSLVEAWNNRAEARAEVLREAADRAIALLRLIRMADEWDDLTDARLSAAILTDEPKQERGQCLDCGNKCPNDCSMDK